MMDENKTELKRLNDLESSLMHLQNDFDALNGVVLENAQRLSRLDRQLKRLTDQLESKPETERPRDPEEEKPPHY